MSIPLPYNEYERLIELSELDLDYSDLHEHLDDLTALAARITGTDVSLVNLIDSYTQWSVSSQGIDIQQMPREDSVCHYTIAQDGSFEVRDLQKDERFSSKAYVTEGLKLRYYLGVPLKTSSGVNIGALCVLDDEPQEINPEDQELLALVANQVVRRLEALKRIKTLQDKVKELCECRRKVSHDIRGPLGGIVGIAEIMKEEIELDRVDEIFELANLIQQGGESLLELAESIMREEESLRQPGEDEFSCRSLADKLKELYMPQARTKGVRLEFRHEEQPAEVFFPKSRLLQIVGNLVSNSIKYTPAAGRVSVSIRIESGEGEDAPRTLTVEVEDTGTGMSDAKIREILQGGAVSERGTAGETGYGFGLALVQHLIRQARGRMDLQSAEGQGTRFRVELPV